MKRRDMTHNEQALWAELKGNEAAIRCLEEQNGKIRTKLNRIEIMREEKREAQA